MKILLAVFALTLALGWYGWLVPTAWHADDAEVFSEAYKTASHWGAIILGAIPPGITSTIFVIKRMMK